MGPAAAAVDAIDEKVFTRDLLAKLEPVRSGLARLDAAALAPGERQLVLLLEFYGWALATMDEGDRRFLLLDAAVHQRLVESLAERPLSVRAAAPAPAGPPPAAALG